jgi:hypothetical protein
MNDTRTPDGKFGTVINDHSIPSDHALHEGVPKRAFKGKALRLANFF